MAVVASRTMMQINREMQAVAEDPRLCQNCVTIKGMRSDSEPLVWIIHLVGPSDTLYSGGIFRALLRFPSDYPFAPPSLQFTSSILHPNIYKDGKVCITSLQTAVPDNLRTKESCPKCYNWNPSLGVVGALLGCVSLLSEPNFDDPANTEAAVLLKEHPSQFKTKCEWNTQKSISELDAQWVHPSVLSEEKQRKEDAASKKKHEDSDGAISTDGEYVYSDEDEEEGEDEEGDSQMSERE